MIILTSAVSPSPSAFASVRWSHQRCTSCFCNPERCFREALCYRHMKCIRSPGDAGGWGGVDRAGQLILAHHHRRREGKEKTQVPFEGRAPLALTPTPSRLSQVAAAERMESAIEEVCSFQSVGCGGSEVITCFFLCDPILYVKLCTITNAPLMQTKEDSSF